MLQEERKEFVWFVFEWERMKVVELQLIGQEVRWQQEVIVLVEGYY